MTSPINTLLSGLNAASLRTSVAANNIANSRSTAEIQNGKTVNKVFVPQDVIQINQENGGALASVAYSNRPAISQFEPDSIIADENGFVQYPDVDLAEELVNVQQAASDYKATLSALEIYKDSQKSLLDIFA